MSELGASMDCLRGDHAHCLGTRGGLSDRRPCPCRCHAGVLPPFVRGYRLGRRHELIEAERRGYDRDGIHLWFSLSYANYLVTPRSVLQSMPDDWQARFCMLLDEAFEAFGHLDWPTYHVQALARETDWITPYAPCPDCVGDDGGDSDPDCSTCDGEGEIEDPEGPRYETAEEVGFRADPIPHYNRGRTRLEPRGHGRV